MWNDVEALRTIARSLQHYADGVGDRANEAQGADPGWISDAAADYQGRLDQAISDLRASGDQIREASTAMFVYADAVEGHIADLVALAEAVGEGVDHVWGLVQDGASTAVDFLSDAGGVLKDGADALVDGAGRALDTVKSWAPW